MSRKGERITLYGNIPSTESEGTQLKGNIRSKRSKNLRKKGKQLTNNSRSGRKGVGSRSRRKNKNRNTKYEEKRQLELYDEAMGMFEPQEKRYQPELANTFAEENLRLEEERLSEKQSGDSRRF